MLEIPESRTLARQLNETVAGKTVRKAAANAAPHKLAFYSGDPEAYGGLLTGKTVESSAGLGAMVELCAGDCRVVLGDGANLRYYPHRDLAPARHQLYIEFDDQSALVCTVAMYGAVLAFIEGQCDNPYYHVAKSRPQPLDDGFDRTYFDALRGPEADKLSAKAFLATQQRIPGLGNGVLQDILFFAGIHPRRKIGTLSKVEYDALFRSVKNTLGEMTALGGRDTEKDLFGSPGGYVTRLSKNTAGKPCPVCKAAVQKAAYMGGSVYWCPACQPLAE